MRANIWIRRENEEQWAKIKNKSEFVNELFQEHVLGKFMTHEWVGKEKDEIVKKEKVGVNLCKVHGTPLTVYGKCLMKGCKYA